MLSLLSLLVPLSSLSVILLPYQIWTAGGPWKVSSFLFDYFSKPILKSVRVTRGCRVFRVIFWMLSFLCLTLCLTLCLNLKNVPQVPQFEAHFADFANFNPNFSTRGVWVWSIRRFVDLETLIFDFLTQFYLLVSIFRSI